MSVYSDVASVSNITVITDDTLQDWINKLHVYSANLEEAEHSQQAEQTITTYYVDQDGQYYYKPSSECDEVVELEDPFVDAKVSSKYKL